MKLGTMSRWMLALKVWWIVGMLAASGCEKRQPQPPDKVARPESSREWWESGYKFGYADGRDGVKARVKMEERP